MSWVTNSTVFEFLGEKLLVLRLVGPFQVLRRVLEFLGRLLHVGAHDFIGFRRIVLDQVERLEIAVRKRLGGFGIGLEEVRRAADRVEHHRVIERGRQDVTLVGFVAHRRDERLISHRRVVLAGKEGLRRGVRLQIDDGHVLGRHAVLVQHPGEHEIGRRAGRRGRDGLALEVGDRLDVVAGDDAVGAIGFVELEYLLRRHAIGVPYEPGFDRGGGALQVAAGDGERPAGLRYLLQDHIEPVLLENSGLLGECQRREAGPSTDADGDRRCGHHRCGQSRGERQHCRKYGAPVHVSSPFVCNRELCHRRQQACQ